MGGILKHSLMLITIVTLGLAFGCAKKQSAAVSYTKAKAAIQAAQTAEASTYAPLDLRIAEDKLAEAQTADSKRDYKEAKMLAEEATITAKLAEQKAGAEKAKQATDKVKESIEGLNQAIKQP